MFNRLAFLRPTIRIAFSAHVVAFFEQGWSMHTRATLQREFKGQDVHAGMQAHTSFLGIKNINCIQDSICLVNYKKICKTVLSKNILGNVTQINLKS